MGRNRLWRIFHGKEVEARRAVREPAGARTAQERRAAAGGSDGPGWALDAEGREEGGGRPALPGFRFGGPRNRRAGEAQGGREEGGGDAQAQRLEAKRRGEEGREDAGEDEGLARGTLQRSRPSDATSPVNIYKPLDS